VEPHEAKGQPGAILRDRDGKVVNTWTLDIVDGQIPAAICIRSGGRSGPTPTTGTSSSRPEYNGDTPASLKNAIDCLFQERTRKAVAYVGHGVFGAVTAVQELRAQAGRLQMADIGPQVALSLRALPLCWRC
jgi:hypothetical protein